MCRFFIGNSLGFVIRQPIGNFTWRWASLKTKITAYVDYGATYVYSGYNYSYNGFSGFKERYQAEFPILVSLRGHHNRLSLKKWRKNEQIKFLTNGSPANRIEYHHFLNKLSMVIASYFMSLTCQSNL